MSEEMVMLSGRVPPELKDLVDADHRDNQEILRAALWREFGGERKSDLERRVEEKKNRINMLERERNERDRALSQRKDELAALQSKLDAVEQHRGEYTERLDEILDQMETHGDHVWPDAEPIRDFVTEHDTNPDAVLSQLKERAAEQGRDITTHQFMRADVARRSDTADRRITEVDDV